LDLFFAEIKSETRCEAGDGTDGNGNPFAAPQMALLEEKVAYLM